MLMITVHLLLLLAAHGAVLDRNPTDDVFVVRLNTEGETPRKVLAEILDVRPEDVITSNHSNGKVSFTILPTDPTMSFDEVMAKLAASPLVSLTSEDPSEEPTEVGPFWTKLWFVIFLALITGVLLCALLIPLMLWLLKKRKKGELQKLDGTGSQKRYDTIGRDGSIQSRRKLAPTTLTLQDLSTHSSEGSDNDTSPPGIKEALQSRTNPLTPLQLRQRLDNPALLYGEFSALPANEETRSSRAPSLKNRYKGVLPNLHTRVKLGNSLDGYINANYIRGFKGVPRVYIATQGPLKNTIDDFWDMIWQENVSTIVMITKIQEKGRSKCSVYWPETVETYGNFTVTVRDSTHYEGFTVTSMLVTDGIEVHKVCHLWMWSWPDQGVPESSRQLLSLLSCVHSIWNTGISPLVIHCSAGLGRTGCFIAVDIGIQALRQEKVVDVLRIVASMRLDRGGMVQTLEQYEFIHRALLRYEVSTRNKHRFKGLRKSSFSHEGAPEELYAMPRRMSYSVSRRSIPDHIDITSTSLPSYISLPPEVDIPSPDSPKPPSLLQLSKLMEKSSKRKISHLKRAPAFDFSSDVECTEQLRPPKTADESPQGFLKTPVSLTKSSFSLDYGRTDVSRKLPRSASEDTPDSPNTSSREHYTGGKMPCSFTFDFDTIPEPSPHHRQSPLDSPILINS